MHRIFGLCHFKVINDINDIKGGSVKKASRGIREALSYNYMGGGNQKRTFTAPLGVMRM